MPCCPPSLLGVGPRLRSFLRDYDALQSLALVLIYLQVRIPLPCRLRWPDRPGPFRGLLLLVCSLPLLLLARVM